MGREWSVLLEERWEASQRAQGQAEADKSLEVGQSGKWVYPDGEEAWEDSEGDFDSSWFLTCGGLDVRVPFGALFDTETSFPSGKCLRYYDARTSQTLGSTALSPQHMLRLVLGYRTWLSVSLWFTWAAQVSPRPTL